MSSMMETCILCENGECVESYTHQKVSMGQFQKVLRQSARTNIYITHLWNKITTMFYNLQRMSQPPLEPYILEVYGVIEILKYWSLVSELGQVQTIEALLHHQQVPRNQLLKVFQILNTNRSHIHYIFPGFRALDHVLAEIQSNDYAVIKSSENYSVFATKIRECIYQVHQTSISPNDSFIIAPVCLRSRSRTAGGEVNPRNEQVIIEGIPMSVYRKGLNLSMLKVSDEMILKYSPAIEKMRHLQEIELRNNSISTQGYRVLFNLTPCQTLQSLDIRHTPLSDRVVKLLCEKMPHLKSLHISGTELTDEALDLISTHLTNLEMLQVSNNDLTIDSVLRAVENLEHLHYLAVANNRMDYNEGYKVYVEMMKKRRKSQVDF